MGIAPRPGVVDVGNLIAGDERLDGEHADVTNPSRLTELVGGYRLATPEDALVAVDGAARAQRAWATTPVEERVTAMEHIAVAIESDAERIATTLARESGSPIGQARGEVRGAASTFRNAAAHAAAVLADREVDAGAAGGRIVIGRRPFGVIACIVPWNAPLGLAAQKLGPALVTGNAAVLKPSPLAPLALTLLVRAAASLLPPGLLSVVNGGGDLGSALIGHPRVRMVSFTGGGSTARAIMRLAAETLTHVHFELGGNDPAILLDDADLDLAAERLAASAFRRSGQVCYAVKRIYVPERMRADFADRLSGAVSALTVGDSLDERTLMGPVNNRAQFDFVSGLIDAARARGRDVRALGQQLDPAGWEGGYFLRPTLVTDAEPDDDLVQVEQFGPVLPIVGYRDEEQALGWANATEYGLGASVWSADAGRATALAQRVESGVAFVNNHVLSRAALRSVPFGGVKQSGMGWENSPAGLEEYLEFHSIDVHPTDA